MTTGNGGAKAPDLQIGDYRLEHFKLDVAGSSTFDVDLAKSVTAADLALTIEGASTVTVAVEDPHLKLLTSATLTRWAWGENRVGQEDDWVRRGRAVDFKLDTLPFRLVKVSKSGTRLTLTFEDRQVALLREKKGARKASRGKVTRAQFIAMLAAEVKAFGGIELHIPSRKKRQPIAKATGRTPAQARREDGHQGFATDVELHGVQGRLLPSQVRNAERVLDTAYSHNAPEKAVLALVEACIVEAPDFKNPVGGDASSSGILQLLSIHLGGSTSTNGGRRDIEKVCSLFLTDGFTGQGGAISLARRHPDWTAGQIAQAVQGSAYPDRYGNVRELAEKIIAAYTGGGGRSSTHYKRYEYARGKHESSWDAMGRLADEVAWRRFMRKGRLWYMSEVDLFKQAPQLTISRDDDGRWKDGVTDVDFDLDLFARRPVAEVQVKAHSGRWTVLPGMVVVLKDAGPASGRWLVSSVSRSLLDESGEVDVTLRKPIPPKAEPRPETTSGSSSGASGDSGSLERLYAEMKVVDGQGRSYVYGGGHKALSAISAHEGLDCSSSCSLVLWKAGLFDGHTAIVSGAFSSWGKPGKGKRMTVWYNGEHVWIEIHVPGKRAWRFDTSPHGSGGYGPHLRYTPRSTAGFTPRHWPGL